MGNKLTAEQIDKLKACKTSEEAMKLAEKEKIELADEELEAIAGGERTTLLQENLSSFRCEHCGRCFNSDAERLKHFMSCTKRYI